VAAGFLLVPWTSRAVAQDPGSGSPGSSPQKPPAASSPAASPGDGRAELLSGLDRFHISGNADLEFLYGQSNSFASGTRFLIDNARVYLDVDLAREVTLGSGLLAQEASFYIEGDLYREARFTGTVGSLYLRVDGVGGVREINLKFGRFLVPFGEEYLRFSEGRPENPLLSFSVAAPYGWDDGILAFGALFEDQVRYFFALSSGDAYFNQGSGTGVSVEGKLTVRPAPWIELSVSGLHINRIGTAAHPAQSALEWSGENLRPLGYGSAVPSFQEGAVIPPDPDGRLRDLAAWEGDLVLHAPEWGRLWLGYGGVDVHSGGSSLYDRSLRYAVVEAVFEMRALAGDLEPFYLAARWSVIGTFDSARGYLLGGLNAGDALGWNTERVTEVSVGVGFRMTSNIVLKVEASSFDFDLVRGVTPDLKSAATHRNYAGVGVSVHF
jgi:hypothetical protein